MIWRSIKNLGIKICLTNEGKNKLFDDFYSSRKHLNKHWVPSRIDKETSWFSQYDLLKANKAFLALGIKTRPPFMKK